MIEHRPFADLGRFENDWLSARHHFSFGHYSDPARTGHGKLRVWNDDTIAPGAGFDRHGHRDMEIITYVRRGAITHRDHLGNEGRTEAGSVQVMSAGKGILHEEYNLESGETQIFQIWIEPDRAGVPPRWEARAFPQADRSGQLVALASGRSEHAEALPIYQDATVYGARLAAGQTIAHQLVAGRKGYLVPASGRIRIGKLEAAARDGVAVSDETDLAVMALEDSDIVLVEAP